jgi:hypothetical protein
LRSPSGCQYWVHREEVLAEGKKDIEFKKKPELALGLIDRSLMRLNRVVRSYFGDKGQSTPVLAFRHGEQQDNCKALRAAYGALATERDCDRSVGSKMLHYARLLGHFVKENPTDKELQGVATTLGYADYFTSSPIPFPTAPQKEKVVQVRTTDEDFETIKQLQALWKLPNQQSVVSRLIERHEKNVKLGKQLQEYKAHINQLENQLKKAWQLPTNCLKCEKL